MGVSQSSLDEGRECSKTGNLEASLPRVSIKQPGSDVGMNESGSSIKKENSISTTRSPPTSPAKVSVLPVIVRGLPSFHKDGNSVSEGLRVRSSDRDPDFDRTLPAGIENHAHSRESSHEPSNMRTGAAIRGRSKADGGSHRLFNPATDSIPMIKKEPVGDTNGGARKRRGNVGVSHQPLYQGSRALANVSEKPVDIRRNKSEHHSASRQAQAPGWPNDRQLDKQESSEEPRTRLLLKKVETFDDEEMGDIFPRESAVLDFNEEAHIEEIRRIYAALTQLEEQVKASVEKWSQSNICKTATSLFDTKGMRSVALSQKELLYMYYDFITATQHPKAESHISKLLGKHMIVSRLWRHGIANYLDLLQSMLPAVEAEEYMMSHIYFSYTLAAKLLIVVPDMKYEWIQYLGDLSKYRIALEPQDSPSREVWSETARGWFLQSSILSPISGRFYFQLGSLSDSDPLYQLFYYCKAALVLKPVSSIDSAMQRLFDVQTASRRQASYDLDTSADIYVWLHQILFTGTQLDDFEDSVDEFLALLQTEISWQPIAGIIAFANIAALLQYGREDSQVNSLANPSATKPAKEDIEFDIKASAGLSPDEDIVLSQSASSAIERTNWPSLPTSTTNSQLFDSATYLTFSTLSLACSTDFGTALSYVSTCLVFLLYSIDHERLWRLIESRVPWEALADFLTQTVGGEMISHSPSTIERRLESTAEQRLVDGTIFAQNVISMMSPLATAQDEPKNGSESHLAELDHQVSVSFLVQLVTLLLKVGISGLIFC